MIMDKKRSLDLLSDLPLGIIQDILSLVPIKDAVRTSILSRQWRFIWCSLPRLVFDGTFGENGSLLYFISRVLLLHKGPIHEFQLRLLASRLSTAQCQQINQWLLFLSRNHIRILVIDIYECSYAVNSSVYSCQNLTRLKLRVQTIPPLPPSFKGFLFLRSLYIFSNDVDSSNIESIVAHSPQLEELTLVGFRYFKMTICAPNLKCHFFSVSGHFSLCTPLLQELKGSFEGSSSFRIGVESLVFHHLRTIKLSNVPFDNKEVTHDVICLITASPNLEKLQISAWNYPKKVAYLWDTESAPDFTYNSLKVIKMEYCLGELNEMKLIEFLLARSPVLVTLMYNPSPTISDKKFQKLTNQLLRYHRASANVQIVISL